MHWRHLIVICLFVQRACVPKLVLCYHRRQLMQLRSLRSHAGIWIPCKKINASSFLAPTVFRAQYRLPLTFTPPCSEVCVRQRPYLLCLQCRMPTPCCYYGCSSLSFFLFHFPLKLVLFSPLWKQAQMTWNSNTMCWMVPLHVPIYFLDLIYIQKTRATATHTTIWKSHQAASLQMQWWASPHLSHCCWVSFNVPPNTL